MFDSSTIAAIENLVKSAPQVIEIHTDDTTVKKLVIDGTTQPTIETYPLRNRRRAHKFDTLDSLIAYLVENETLHTAPIVFASEDEIRVDLDYEKPYDNHVRLPLIKTQEFLAFSNLSFKVNTQKEFWRALITTLADNIDKSLALSIAQIKTTRTKNAEIQIDETGLTDLSADDKVNICIGGDKTATIKLEWAYTGPIYDAIETHYTIPFRLEFSANDNGLLIIGVHPKHLKRTLKLAHADIIARLKKETPDGVNVYAGTQ